MRRRNIVCVCFWPSSICWDVASRECTRLEKRKKEHFGNRIEARWWSSSREKRWWFSLTSSSPTPSASTFLPVRCEGIGTGTAFASFWLMLYMVRTARRLALDLHVLKLFDEDGRKQGCFRWKLVVLSISTRNNTAYASRMPHTRPELQEPFLVKLSETDSRTRNPANSFRHQTSKSYLRGKNAIVALRLLQAFCRYVSDWFQTLHSTFRQSLSFLLGKFLHDLSTCIGSFHVAASHI